MRTYEKGVELPEIETRLTTSQESTATALLNIIQLANLTNVMKDSLTRKSSEIESMAFSGSHHIIQRISIPNTTGDIEHLRRCINSRPSRLQRYIEKPVVPGDSRG